MVMFLMIVCASLPVLLICALVVASGRRQDSPPEVVDANIHLPAPRFFADRAERTSGPALPIEVMLSQIERHVRLETAVAETFLDGPTPAALHTRMVSPTLN